MQILGKDTSGNTKVAELETENFSKMKAACEEK